MKKIAAIISDSILPNAQEYIYYSAIYDDGKMIIKVDVKKEIHYIILKNMVEVLQDVLQE